MGHHTKPRRKDLTSEEVEQMKQLEAQGKTRKEIASALGCDASAVTRKLGAVRTYKGLRLKVA